LPDTGPAPSGHIIYVNKNVVGGEGSGRSWDDAMPELADVLRLASSQWGEDGSEAGWNASNPLEIWVAGGEYKPLYHAADGALNADGGRNNAFVMVPHVQLYGGFMGMEVRREARDWNANTTILSGDIGVPGDHTDNAYHVVVAAGNTNYPIQESVGIDGFTITGGNGDASGIISVNGQDIG